MTVSYREPRLPCPACSKPLRESQGRQICDACNGVLLAVPDLSREISDIAGLDPKFEFVNESPGKRICPKCTTWMTTLKLRIALTTDIGKPRPEIDRCPEHGLWFDKDELAAVLEKVAAKSAKATGGRRGRVISGSSGSYGWNGPPTPPLGLAVVSGVSKW